MNLSESSVNSHLNKPLTSATINVVEYEALVMRVATLESLIREFMIKQRELAIIEMSDIEQRLGMPRTKEKRKP